MNVASHELAVSVDVSASLVALVTLAAAFVFGLALVPRPSRSTAVWGVAFGLGMLGTYLWVAGNESHLPTLQALSSGLMTCFTPLIWLGLRLYRDQRRTYWVLVFATIAAMPAALALTVGSDLYPPVFRAVFAVSGVFAGLVVYELIALRLRSVDVVLPLMLASGAYVLVVVLAVIDGALHTTGGSTAQLGLLRDINGIGTLVYSQCTAITVVLLARQDRPRSEGQPGERSALAERLARAEAQRDTTWSLLDIRLDDPDDLRTVVGAAEFARISAACWPRLYHGFPSTADILRVDDTRCLVLISGSETMVRRHIREFLDVVADVDAVVRGPAAVRPSASIGWAAVTDFGFDYAVLCAAAADGAARARAGGGDRWERVGTVTTRTGSVPVTLEG